MDFLPENYEYASKSTSYWKMKDMLPGDNRFRIVQKPIAGWIDWKDNKPFRYPPKNKPTKSFDPEKEVKSFWSVYVWDYARKDLFILEITQTSIIKSLINLAKDEEWGDFTNYDLKLKKEGSGQQTKYLLSPLPPKPIADEIKLALRAKPANLEALYYNGDPWSWEARDEIVDPRANEVPSESTIGMTPLEELKESLEIERVPTDRLEEWIKLRCQTKNEAPDVVIKACLEKGVLPRFIKSFNKWLAGYQEAAAV